MRQVGRVLCQMGEEERLEREPKKLKRGVDGSGGSG
jgi:hypothetical protein